MIRQKEYWKQFAIGFNVGIFTVAAGLSGFVGLFFKSDDKFIQKLQSLGLTGLLIVILTGIVVGQVWAAIRTSLIVPNQPIEIQPKNSIYDELLKELEKLLTDKHYDDVIRLGSSVSRALWLSGQYEHRIAIGEIIFDAACKIPDLTQMARTQIDDIGWTQFIVKNQSEAKTSISTGLEYASQINDYYLVVKAHRHLASMIISDSSVKHFSEAEKHLNAAREAVKQITNAEKKTEMLNGLQYAQVELLIAKGKTDAEKMNEALNAVQEVLDAYSRAGDRERHVKVLSQKGRIQYIMSDYAHAIGTFNTGLGIAERINRTDEYIKCSMGLAVTYYKKGELIKASRHIKACRDPSLESVVFAFWDEIYEDFNKIKNI